VTLLKVLLFSESKSATWNLRTSRQQQKIGLHSPKKFKYVTSAGKVMVTDFWDIFGIIYISFLPYEFTVIIGSYFSTLKRIMCKNNLPR